MKRLPKRLDRSSFWKWAIPFVLGLVVLVILGLSGAARSVGEINTVVIVVSAMALARVILIVLLAMALTWRFRDIGWPAWIGPTILLVTMLGLPLLVVGYRTATYDSDIVLEWGPMVGWISDFVSLVLLIVAGSTPEKATRAQNIEVAHTPSRSTVVQATLAAILCFCAARGPVPADPDPVGAYYQRPLCEEVPVGGE
jgi:uncharacterized membrane protein YhaH (DUF805 family)